MIVFLFVITSCGVQNKAIMANTVTSGEPSSYWRVEIRVQTINNDVYNVLAVLGNHPQPVSLSLFNDLPGRSSPGTIVVYVTATDNQVQQLRMSLFEGGAINGREKKALNISSPRSQS